MKVLVADDDPDQLSLRCLVLEQNGFATLQATNFEGALEAAREERPDCAIVDLRFPTEELGLKLLNDLRALDAGIRLILLTGAAKSGLANRPETAAADEIVQKSAGARSLLSKLHELDQKSRS
jgi:DNA-binding response OmpR family regulator